MTINKKDKGTKNRSPQQISNLSLGKVNPKTGKKYSTAFKKRTVQYYLLGMYDESAIWKKWHVNRHLLRQWRHWYYEAFEKKYCQTHKPLSNEKCSGIKTTNTRASENCTQKRKGTEERKTEITRSRNINRDCPRGQSNTDKYTKKKWRKGVDKLKKEHPYYSIELLAESYGKSRQAYYKAVKKANQEAYYADLIEEEVKSIRKQLPRCGAKKLYGLIKPFLNKHGIKKGRKKFIDVLKAKDLMLRRKRRKWKTTNSNHAFRKHPNLTHNLPIQCANQLWVSDITYIPFGRTFFYLSLVMDAYSRKIVGWDLSESLKAEGAISALKMALATLPPSHHSLIHHSDRGIQYCCHAYVNLLKKYKVKISMTENGDPYENILAERINRTIKEEFMSEFFFGNFIQAKMVAAKSVRFYNNLRPHASLDFLTPQKAHHLKCILKKHWKNPSRKKSNRKQIAINKKSA